VIGRPRWRSGGLLATAVLVVLGLAAVPSLASPGLASSGAATTTPRLDALACAASKPTAFGMPQWVVGCHIGGQALTSPVVGTIDGTKVVVDASLSGWVYVVNARTGREMPGWPQPADLVGSTRTAIESSPAIAYLNGPDAEPSIVVGLGSHYVKNQNGGLMAWYANGKVRFRFRTKKTFNEWGSGPADYSDSVVATPAIGDVTGNGQQDIVFGADDHYVYALNPSGKVLPGFPIQRADTIKSSPALADTTRTGKMDIIEGGDASGWRGPNGRSPPCYSGWISDYRYVDGGPRLIWEHCLAETVWSSPAVTTFGSTPVVVVGTSWFYGAGRHTEPAEKEVFAYNALTGKLLPGWPVDAGGPTFGSPAVGPAAPGGPNEVFESSCADCLQGPAIVTAWNEAGRRLWETHITLHSELLASPSLANVTNFASKASRTNDVLIGNVSGLYVLNAVTGKKVAGTNVQAINPSCNVVGTAAVSAVPGSKTGWMMFTNCGFAGPTRSVDEFLRAYNIPAPAGAPPWPMFRANAQRTGVPDPSSAVLAACRVPSTPTGYRLASVAGSVYDFGGAANCGSLSGRLLPEDVAGIASTPNGGGYWIALRDGAVYAFGDARNYGDLRGDSWRGGPAAPGAPVVGIAATPDGNGYYVLGGDGSVYAFGDATYHGSPGGYKVAGVPIGIAVDSATGGYWITTASGHVYAFDAPSYGEKTSGHVSPIVAMATMPNGTGYWLVTGSGYVFNFGSANSYGNNAGAHIVGMAASSNGDGYYLVSSKGAVYQHGQAAFHGSATGRTAGAPVIGIATP
jgi:hypothetical protein